MSKSRLSIKERFLSHVNIPADFNDCWIWTKSLFSSGYGKFSIEHKNHYAHRVSFELFVGPIPDKLFVCHSCDNKLCVNPLHLWLGTHQDNMDDKVKKNRQTHTRGELDGVHKLTEQDVYKIREMIEQGINQHEIAKMFGVDHATISAIKTGQSWSWLK